MNHDEYLDEPEDVIAWTLHIADLRGDHPWEKERRRGQDAGPA
jgi:hypothetical protein